MPAPTSSRRAFLLASTAALCGVALQGCHAKSHDTANPPAPPAVPVLDTHTHFYDPSRPQGVPWPPKGDALLYRPVLPKEYIALARPLGVVGTVVVEASPWVEDNRFVLDLAKDEPFILGLCGNLKPGEPAFAADLARFAKDPLFRGIRVAGDDWRPRAADPKLLDDLKRLADADLELDLNVGVPALPDAARLVGRLPGLRVVLNHCANVPIDGREPPAAWADGIRALAGRPNVFAKLSGLVEGTGKRKADAPADVAFYKPILDAMWAAFGADRLIYGSNWPVSARFAPLDRVQAIVRAYVETKGEAATKAVFAGNAMKAYKVARRTA
ncbi:MAG TPA: amidohydrolase family protein [Humisphaera sp.]